MNELINEILEIKEADEYDMELLAGLNDEEIIKFEQENNLIIPSDYKEWLKFSDGGCLFDGTIQLYGIKNKPTIEIEPEGIGEEYIQIGALNFGDAICFINNSPKIFQYGETTIEYNNFKEFLTEIIEIGIEE